MPAATGGTTEQEIRNGSLFFFCPDEANIRPPAALLRKALTSLWTDTKGAMEAKKRPVGCVLNLTICTPPNAKS